MRPAFVVCLLVWSGVVRATPLEDACKALEKKAVAAAFPDAKVVLCAGGKDRCEGLDEAKCNASAACQAKRGSGSGAGCMRCTPDFVFWRCESAPVDLIVSQVLAFEVCLQKKGKWSRRSGPFGVCDVPMAIVTGRIINAGADVVLRINDVEQPDALRGAELRLSLEANVETKLEVLDRKSGKVVAHTVTLKPQERRLLNFTFPK